MNCFSHNIIFYNLKRKKRNIKKKQDLSVKKGVLLKRLCLVSILLVVKLHVTRRSQFFLLIDGILIILESTTKSAKNTTVKHSKKFLHGSKLQVVTFLGKCCFIILQSEREK